MGRLKRIKGEFQTESKVVLRKECGNLDVFVHCGPGFIRVTETSLDDFIKSQKYIRVCIFKTKESVFLTFKNFGDA